MRFERLRLDAFGPFTDTEIDLSGGAPGGLHVIYGPNEAGKSTSLRAVRALLFGMPHSSVDAHLHPSAKLKVGALLSHGQESFDLVRLKRRKDSLVSPDGSPVAMDPLPALLGQIDEESFARRFGLDQGELEKGAEALLGGTEQGLFSAGTAGASVKEVLSSLEQESAELFLPRGKKPLLNRLQVAFEQANRELRRSERPPEKWLEQERAHRAAEEEQARLRERRTAVRAELRRLSRLRSVMAELRTWQEDAARLAELADIVDLPETAAEQREHWTAMRREAEVEARRVREELQQFETSLAGLPADSALADIDDEKLSLGARVERARLARASLPEARAEWAQVLRQLAGGLRELGLENASGQELELARQASSGKHVATAVRRLAGAHSGLIQADSSAERRLEDLQRQRAAHPATETARDLTRAEAVLAEARGALPLLNEARQLDQHLAELSQQLAQLRAKVGFDGDPLTDLAELPSLESTRAAVSRLSHEQTERERRAAELLRLDERLCELERSLQRHKDVPTEEALGAARSERDACLERVLDEPGQLSRLARLVAAADQLADRLRNEAREVAERRVGEEQMEELRAQHARLQAELESLDSSISAAEQRYVELVERLGVRRAPEALQAEELVRQLESLVQLATARAAEQERREVLQTQLRGASTLLTSMWTDLDLQDLDLAGVVTAAEKRLRDDRAAAERAELHAERAVELDEAIRAASVERERAQADLAQWSRSWEAMVHPLGLRGDVSAEDAMDALDRLDRLDELVKQGSALEAKILRDEQEIAVLGQDVGHAARTFLGVTDQDDPVEVAARLLEGIRSARAHRAERLKVRQLVEERRVALASVEARRLQAQEQLEQLMRAAGVSELEALIQRELASRDKRMLSRKVEQTLARIRTAAEGRSPEECLAEAAEFDGAVLALIERVDALEDETTRLDEELRLAEAQVEEHERELATFRSQSVAIARQVATDRAAAAQSALREYLVLRAAESMLAAQMRTYAEQLSGPIAARAGEMFRHLTLGKYTGLSIGLGEQTLRCVRGGQQVEVHQLSRGTRAQLYFALRLASLEHYFGQHAPLPLVFDDLFVDFDDDRTCAAFELLATLSQRVQVLYFTHLARDLEKAQDAVPRECLFSHKIGVD